MPAVTVSRGWIGADRTVLQPTDRILAAPNPVWAARKFDFPRPMTL
jgi:hypothetical protein